MEQPPTTEELAAANKELLIQNAQNEKRIAEQQTILLKLEERHAIMEKQCADLELTNEKLTVHIAEKEKMSEELSTAYKQLKKADVYLKEYISGLEEMMHMTSHKVRKPIANILGITSIISNFINSPTHLKKLVKYLKASATSLDIFVKELTAFIADLERKGRNQD